MAAKTTIWNKLWDHRLIVLTAQYIIDIQAEKGLRDPTGQLCNPTAVQT